MDKAYRMWKDQLKYISRLKKNLYYWTVKDESPPKGWRNAKDWRELDTSDSVAKQYKKTPTKWSSVYDQMDAHMNVKRMRNDSKKIIDDYLKNN